MRRKNEQHNALAHTRTQRRRHANDTRNHSIHPLATPRTFSLHALDGVEAVFHGGVGPLQLIDLDGTGTDLPRHAAAGTTANAIQQRVHTRLHSLDTRQLVQLQRQGRVERGNQ